MAPQAPYFFQFWYRWSPNYVVFGHNMNGNWRNNIISVYSTTGALMISPKMRVPRGSYASDYVIVHCTD